MRPFIWRQPRATAIMTPLQQAENIKKREIVTLIKQHLSEAWHYLLISRR
jgi:hypothetical protein